MQRLAVWVASILLFVAQPSFGEIVQQGGYSTDTDSGLDWRDATLTRNMSYNEVLAQQAPGQPLEDWRYATWEEFDELMNNIGVPYADGLCAPSYCDTYDDLEPVEIETAIAALGDTLLAFWDSDPNDAFDYHGVGATYGILAEPMGTNARVARVWDSHRITNIGDIFVGDAEDAVTTDWRGGGFNSATVFVFRVDRIVGSLLVRDTTYVPPEICDNGIDDDGDGLTDGDDPDCAPPVGLQVRCMHAPIYPQAGEEVTITAQGIDANGDLVPSNEIEIYVNTMAMPFKRAGGTGVGTLPATYTPTGGDFSYGCRAVKATETAQSWRLGNAVLRSVDVGGANNPDWEAQPVFYNGPIKNKIDIVFFHDDTEYTSYVQPAFLTAVHDLINDGLWSIPWFVEHQWAFNFWIARADGADASPEPGPPPAGQTNSDCNRGKY